jgi:hypothetical protein
MTYQQRRRRLRVRPPGEDDNSGCQFAPTVDRYKDVALSRACRAMVGTLRSSQGLLARCRTTRISEPMSFTTPSPAQPSTYRLLQGAPKLVVPAAHTRPSPAMAVWSRCDKRWNDARSAGMPVQNHQSPRLHLEQVRQRRHAFGSMSSQGRCCHGCQRGRVTQRSAYPSTTEVEPL